MSPRRERIGIALGRMLATRSADGGSGIVTAERGRLRRLFCLERGWLVHAASNLIEEQLVEMLVRRGLLTPADRARITEEARRRGTREAAVLARRRLVQPDTLRQAVAKHVVGLVSSCLEWPDGHCTFTPGIPDLSAETTVRVAVVPLLLGHARRVPGAGEALRARVGSPDLRLSVSPRAQQILRGAELDRTGEDLLALCDGTRPLGQVLACAPGNDERALRTLYGLMLLGVLQSSGSRAEEPHAEPALTRDECTARLRVAPEADHYEVLGIDRQATPAQIRQAYYALARRYHPDRFRAGTLEDLLPLAEEFFRRVTEASNTLSRPELRRDYDESLAGSSQEPATRADTSSIARQNYTRARTLLERRHWAEALTFLQNAVRLDPVQPDYQLALGELLARNPRRRADAEQHLLCAAELAPASPLAYVALGSLYARAGRTTDAARVFREALRWDPANAAAAAGLAELGPVEGSQEAGGPRVVFGS